jgi:hypothetical protein
MSQRTRTIVFHVALVLAGAALIWFGWLAHMGYGIG